jgi:hypothetical protein
MTERALVLVLAIGLAWLAVRWWERCRTANGRLTPGLTVLTAPGCTLCDPAVAALRDTGTTAPITVVDVERSGVAGIRSVPTVVAVRGDGTIALQRSGASAIRDAAALAAAVG